MGTIRADEISNIIRERIEQYNREVKIVNTGTVLQVGDGIARIHGLDEVMAGELVEFEEGTIGIALNLESNNVGVVLMGDGLMMILHVFRVYLTGGFKKPRELTWVTGVILAVLTASFGVTGYSLPRDQVGYWAVKIVTGVPEAIPVIGSIFHTVPNPEVSSIHMASNEKNKCNS